MGSFLSNFLFFDLLFPSAPFHISAPMKGLLMHTKCKMQCDLTPLGAITYLVNLGAAVLAIYSIQGKEKMSSHSDGGIFLL